MVEKKELQSKSYTKAEPLLYHQYPFPGKFTVKTTKAMNNAKDLSLAYSPGVAEPCLEIHKDQETAYKYTCKGNQVAVVSNGTAVLGLGNLGALASKPVMEGKAVLFNKFAGVEAIDLCIDAYDPDEFVNCVKYLAPTFGGINLEDIKAPDCFYIEEKLKKCMNIPVFHDDQHGTAIVCLAGLINAMEITNKKIEDIKVVVNGAGSAGIACLKLIRSYGAKKQNCYLCDTKGVIYEGRTENMNKWKSELANDTKKRTLEEALDGADVFIGVSVAGAVTQQMLKTMNKDPIIFAMANPNPEISPDDAKEVRPDCIMGTGRSDFPNQVNNVLCFPYIFRGALDVRASDINEAMKLAAAEALAKLAKEKVPDVVKNAVGGRDMSFGRDYIIPTPFDPRIIYEVPMAVAKAAMESGVAFKEIKDWQEYKFQLRLKVQHTHF